MTAKQGTRVVNHILEQMLNLTREMNQPGRNMRHARVQFKSLEGIVAAAHKDTVKHAFSKRMPKNFVFDMNIDKPLNVLPQPRELT